MKQYLFCILAFTFCICSCSNKKTKDEAGNIATVVAPSGKSAYDSTIFEPVYNKLAAGVDLTDAEIAFLSDSIATRADFYHLLAEFQKENLFPKRYNRFESAAESVMAIWLMYPTELDAIPSKIELMETVTHQENDTAFIYYTYRFKTEEPHWAAKDGWMLGVVGPYLKNSKPYDWVNGTFSRFTKEKETTPKKEAAWIHENVYKRSPEQ